MTVIVGQIRREVVATSSPYLTTDIDTAAGLFFPMHASIVENQLSHASTWNYPVSTTPRVLSGDRRRSYFDDFYFRIHMTPVALALGDIYSNVETPLSVWNAYFVNETITDISVPPTIGVQVLEPSGVAIPQDMNPLREIIFTVHTDQAGTPAINDTITFTIGGLDIPLPITGRRLVLFPFPPNWSSPFDETFLYNSWVLNAANGDEQTGSNWGNQPRHSFDYTVLLTGLQMQRAENLLFGRQNHNFGVPHWAEKSKLTSDVVPGATIITLDTTNRSFEIGGSAVIYRDDSNYESLQIIDMTDSSLTCASPLLRAWPLGARVYPIYSGMLGEVTSGTYQTDNKIVMAVSFDCDPTLSPVNTPADAVVTTYRGEEVYLARLNWANAISFSYQGNRDQVDYKSGVVRTYSASGFSKTVRKHNWQLRNRAESRAFRAWLGRREGVARPVWMPTGNTDLTISTPILADSLTFDVQESFYAAYAAGSTVKRDIIILLRDGTYVIRRITDATSLVDGTARLVLDAAVGQDLDASQIKRISFLMLYRMDSNAVTIRWLTDEVGTVESNLITKTSP